MTGELLLRAVLEDPADDCRRLVYADWLEENGQPERAEFVRVQVELAGLSTGELTCPKTGVVTTWHGFTPACRCRACRLRRREYETSCRFCHWDWRGGIPPGTSVSYRRGFVEEVRCDNGPFLGHVAAIFSTAPITEVRLTDLRPGTSYEHPGFWTWVRSPEGVGSLLPDALFRRLRADALLSGPAARPAAAWYASREIAVADLSQACVAHGRAKAGLPPLPKAVTTP